MYKYSSHPPSPCFLLQPICSSRFLHHNQPVLPSLPSTASPVSQTTTTVLHSPTCVSPSSPLSPPLWPPASLPSSRPFRLAPTPAWFRESARLDADTSTASGTLPACAGTKNSSTTLPSASWVHAALKTFSVSRFFPKLHCSGFIFASGAFSLI